MTSGSIAQISIAYLDSPTPPMGGGGGGGYNACDLWITSIGCQKAQ